MRYVFAALVLLFSSTPATAQKIEDLRVGDVVFVAVQLNPDFNMTHIGRIEQVVLASPGRLLVLGGLESEEEGSDWIVRCREECTIIIGEFEGHTVTFERDPALNPRRTQEQERTARELDERIRRLEEKH